MFLLTSGIFLAGGKSNEKRKFRKSVVLRRLLGRRGSLLGPRGRRLPGIVAGGAPVREMTLVTVSVRRTGPILRLHRGGPRRHVRHRGGGAEHGWVSEEADEANGKEGCSHREVDRCGYVVVRKGRMTVGEGRPKGSVIFEAPVGIERRGSGKESSV